MVVSNEVPRLTFNFWSRYIPVDKRRWTEDAAAVAKEEWSAALADHRAKASEAVASAADIWNALLSNSCTASTNAPY